MRGTIGSKGIGRGTPSVSTLYADALGAFLGERGLPPATAPARVGSDLPTPPRLCGSSYDTLMGRASRELGDNALGLRFGTRVGGAGFGMLGIAAASAATLGEAIRHLTQLESITSTLGRATVRRRGDKLHLNWQPVLAVSPAVVEGILSGWVSFGRYLLGEHVDVVQVSLRHRRIAPMEIYDGVFECPVRFETCSYGVTIAAELLDARPRFADPVLSAAIGGWLGHCAIAALHGPVADGMRATRQVAALLGGALPLADADEGSVAARLGMGPRSLQRALRREGSSFRQILNAARAQHAVIALMRGEAALPDLGAEIGFDEQSSLCRAFRNWTGYAPLAFRQRMAGVFRPLRGARDGWTGGMSA
ncbi:AraC family transcriptional regulator [Massilia sp. Dwa41.01b]|uniref:AraC family transcriptional regulator n=1 Tax=unclassified Massilia TaxID=2609279 RepID=UPI0016048C54|nr:MULTISPECIES: AraC family transcriptional regulator [unclassified Massilia]QNA89737.1 AraC family transcriptional regulator [Massilia sp. Dwa41.01b]QNB00634.1 AraC family transcriptional regulator [Massilia sp. Se16.2.3]